MFPGVVPAPYSMVKLGIDVSSGTTDAYSGYLDSGNVTAFSMMHESGTGGAPKYGVVSQLPVLGAVSNPLLSTLAVPRSVDDEASVGYYKTTLSTGVVVELAGTDHAGLYQYTFPNSSLPSVVVDVSHVLPSYRGLGWGQGYAGGSFELFSDGHYEGNGTYNNGWNLAPNWTIYFCGKFSQPPSSSKTFTGSNETMYQYDSQSQVSGTDRLGGVFTFNTTQFTSRVGISFLSSAKACQNLEGEIPSGTALHSLVDASKAAWNEEVLAKVTTTSTNSTLLTQLYTSLYGMFLIPSNRTGENPKWASTEPYYDDIFTFWDLFRCTTALVQVIQPVAYEEQIRSLIDVWRHDGFMPDARSSNFNGRTQGGSNADNVLADAYVKGVRGAVNWEDGFQAMYTDAEVTPPNNYDPSAPDSSTKEGRGALPDWLQYNYITPAFSRAVSRAVEYSANDFGLYQVASGLNKTEYVDRYLQRSRNWRNHWNSNATSLGFNGFVVPRYANGSFAAQDPLSCGGCYWGDAYYEALPWEYSFNAHHDLATLIKYAGGNKTFVNRLNTFFAPGVYSGNSDFNNTIFNPGNEPSFTTPYLYNFVGRQDLAVKEVRFAATTYYNTGTSGIPGNSDAGAMQSWLLWAMIGLYPLTGQTTFLIGSPWFDQMTIDLGGGKALSITSSGGDQTSSHYVQSLRVNGEPWDKAWVTWADVFENGGTMDFVLGEEQTLWATGAVPPSPAS
ncbi:glycoside hydrolase family 92 protein [Saccharata proteae CBS 121410]|uniref:Glycoside hydrolase family 92 protein n=1 Tax=Saccharata proteae CBS 121410 TaxID=1314787 RepID=A0A6A5YCX1_9PEZI|nr:glycoside hydrolase family 92 protein [Saccharata proteae CBS 121410]